MFFKRGLSAKDKVVYFSETCECTSKDVTVRQVHLYVLCLTSKADRMPANQHPVTPEENKLVHSDGAVESFVPNCVARCTALSTSGQLPLKRPSGGSDDQHGGGSAKLVLMVLLYPMLHIRPRFALLCCGLELALDLRRSQWLKHWWLLLALQIAHVSALQWHHEVDSIALCPQ